MKRAYVFGLALGGAMLAGCETAPQRTMMGTAEYAAREPIATSLFPSDQAVLSDEAVARILSSKLEVPAKAKLALMKFPDANVWGVRHYGGDYWRNEEYLKLQQAQADTLATALLASDRIMEAIPLPSLMIPPKMSIPVLREAAVRMQADYLLIYRVTGDTYFQYRVFAKDRAKAYSTCEIVVLDTRTGMVPFTRVVTRERVELKQSKDFDLAETMRRAEETAAIDALKTAADELVAFVKLVPRKGA